MLMYNASSKYRPRSTSAAGMPEQHYKSCPVTAPAPGWSHTLTWFQYVCIEIVRVQPCKHNTTDLYQNLYHIWLKSFMLILGVLGVWCQIFCNPTQHRKSVHFYSQFILIANNQWTRMIWKFTWNDMKSLHLDFSSASESCVQPLSWPPLPFPIWNTQN